MKTQVKWILAVAALIASAASHASTIVLNFSGLDGNAQEAPLNYYDGGTGGDGSGPGPNDGITFGANAITCSGRGGGCASAEIPGGPGANLLFFLNGTADTLDRAAGFTTGFSFDYSAPLIGGVVDVYSGLNGTGTLLAMLNLPVTPEAGNAACHYEAYCPYQSAGITFSGTAESVEFSGTANYIAFADITLGSATAGGGGTTTAPEIDASSAAAALALLFGGVAVLRGRRRTSQP